MQILSASTCNIFPFFPVFPFLFPFLFFKFSLSFELFFIKYTVLWYVFLPCFRHKYASALAMETSITGVSQLWMLSLFSHSSVYSHLGCREQADFVRPKMLPFKGGVFSEFQCYWETPALCGARPRAYSYHLEMARR